ncbi:MAG: hydantoinase B/oxoprolinase family protein [Hyphomicrobiaceae bacterium]
MPIDQITLDILWSRLIATVNEQAAALVRTSFTAIVRDSGDLAAAVFDRRGRMVAQSVTGTPGHINPMATGMVHFLERFPIDTLKPGDVLITNDPWMTASQINDLTIATPVFKNGRAIALFANCCHALDIGGRGLAADSRSVYEEGLYLPLLKLVDAGKPVEPIFDIIRANVRTPEEVIGDIHSQMIANEVGAEQLLSFLDEFGLADIETLSDEIIDRTEAAMRKAIRDIPDGDYRSRMQIDGFDDKPITIDCCVRVRGDDIEIDFAGSSPQVPLGVNVALNYTQGYTTYGLKCAISPDVPNNAGSFRPVRITAPEGSILNARHPAAVGGRHLVGHFCPSAVMMALAGALPEKVQAPGFDGIWNSQLEGELPGDQHKRFAYIWFSAGGTGAMHGKDGLSAVAYPSGIAGFPAEVIEASSPVVMHKRELRQDSGGPGQWRGGLSQVMEYSIRTGKPVYLQSFYERTKHPAPGLHGGRPGAAGRLSADHDPQPVPKITSVINPGTTVRIELPGGGGFGTPVARDPAAVLADVRNGYVSREAAEREYGVVVDTARWAVDEAATRARRAAMRLSA